MADVEERKEDFARVSFYLKLHESLGHPRKMNAHTCFVTSISFINHIYCFYYYSHQLLKYQQERVKLSM